MTLLGRVVFHLEGTETTARRNVSGEPVCLVQTFGFHRWIEEAADGHMTALDLLALVLYHRYFRADDARAVVHGWHEELRRAVEAGEVTPRDPSSLLPCRADFEGLGWLVSRADAARLLKRHQTGIDLDATIAEMLEGARYEGEAHHHPETGEWMESRWLAGYGPKEGGHPPTAIEPVEWCAMLAEGWFLPEAQTPAEPTPAPSTRAPAVAVPEPVAKPLQRQRHQEAEIMRVLRELGHDPHALPRNTPGRAGPKAAAFGRLGWKKGERGVFDKAWERLRQTREIADA